MAGFIKGFPNEKSILIGNNIKVLREIRKKDGKKRTQKELGDYLGISSKTVSSFERGERDVNFYLSQIAKFFDVTVEILKEEKITSHTIQSLTSISWDFARDLSNRSYIRFTSPAALKNKDFVKANDWFTDILSCDFRSLPKIRACRNCYYKAFKEANILAGAANTITLLHLEYIMLDFPDKFLIDAARDTLDLCEVISWSKESSKLLSATKKRFLDETEEIYDECLLALKENDSTASAAEFYLAFKYFTVMVEYESPEHAEAIKMMGLYLFYEYSKLKNQYCERYIECLVENFESVEFLIKSVD